MKYVTKEEKVWLKKFQSKAKARMKELDINLTRVVKLSGLPYSTVYTMLNHQSIPSVTHVIKLAHALAMKPSELIDIDFA